MSINNYSSKAIVLKYIKIYLGIILIYEVFLMENKETVRLLVIIGGIIGIVQAILSFGNWGLGFWGPMAALNIGSSIVGIIIAILVLLSVFRPGDPIPYNAVLLIIFGVLMTFFNSWIGGVLVLVAGILWLVWKL